jgi:transposase
MYYSGIDLHKDMCFITTIDESGIMLKQSKVPNDEHAILNYFFSLGKEHRTVVESTSNWYWLSDLLQNHGIEFILAHAKYLKAISYAKVKTDKVDSETLAQLLRLNLIPAAHQISADKRGMRDMMRARLRLVHKKTSCLNSIHRLLEKFNLAIPNNRPLHEPATLELLNDLPFDSEYRLQLDLLKEQVLLLNRQIKALEKALHPLLIPNPDIQRLLHLPGVGKVLAFTIYLEIDGIERFPDVNRFYSYCRLVPGSDNSNRKLKHKSGSKDGNKYLKLAFTEAGFRAIQYYQEINQFYQRNARKKHNNIARILVAKELAKICFVVLKDKTDFNHTFKGVTLSRVKSRQWPRLSSPAA